MNKVFIALYVFVTLLLFFYSFTQIDLGLSFSHESFLQSVQKGFQYVGYFNRSLSTALYLIVIVCLFILYLLFLKLALERKIAKKLVWTAILLTTPFLLFSYNAFSYDLFNYIFDAKIVTFYNQNPYLHRALDFPSDPMLAFMRWTHRTYPYGPVWLAITVPLSYLGFQSFISTFFLFKILMGASYIGSVFMIGKILRKISPKDEVFGIIFFGLNPLILVESLVSAHVDIVMMFVALFSLFLLIQKKYILSWLLLLLSIGIKFATLFLIPVYIIKSFIDVKDKFTWDEMFYVAVICMSLGIIAASMQSGNFQPWYLFYFLTFATFISKRPIIFFTGVVGSLVGLLNYVPYLFLGVWDTRVPEYVQKINITGLVLIVICTVVFLMTRTRFTEARK